MAKRNVILSDDVEKLTTYYLDHTEQAFSDLVNTALKTYLADALDTKAFQKALKTKDDEALAMEEILTRITPFIER